MIVTLESINSTDPNGAATICKNIMIYEADYSGVTYRGTFGYTALKLTIVVDSNALLITYKQGDDRIFSILWPRTYSCTVNSEIFFGTDEPLDWHQLMSITDHSLSNKSY